MSIADDIANLETELTRLRELHGKGYEVRWERGYEEYSLRDDHEIIVDTDGNLAGIVINQKIMTKYFMENPYGV